MQLFFLSPVPRCFVSPSSISRCLSGSLTQTKTCLLFLGVFILFYFIFKKTYFSRSAPKGRPCRACMSRGWPMLELSEVRRVRRSCIMGSFMRCCEDVKGILRAPTYSPCSSDYNDTLLILIPLLLTDLSISPSPPKVQRLFSRSRRTQKANFFGSILDSIFKHNCARSGSRGKRRVAR